MQQALDGLHAALSMTLRQVFETYYLPGLVDEGRLSTAAFYRTSLTRWERRTSNPPVCSIDNATLEAFRTASLAENRPATFNGDRRSIRAILQIGRAHV